MTDRDDYERLAELADGIEGAGRFSFTGDYVLLPSMTRRDRDLVATALRRAASVKAGEVVGVQVKPLNFIPASEASCYFVARSIFGAIWISEYPGSTKPFKLDTHLAITFHDTIEAAKAAAQADYEARIRSALVVEPVKGEPEATIEDHPRGGTIWEAFSNLYGKLDDEDCAYIDRELVKWRGDKFAAPTASVGLREALLQAQHCIARETTRCIFLETTIRDAIEALERNSTSAPVVECLKAALAANQSDGGGPTCK